MSDEKIEQENVTAEVLPAEEGKETPTQRYNRNGSRLSHERKKAKAVELAAQGVAMSDIARAVGLPKSTVKDCLKRFKPVFKKLGQVNDFRSARADIISAAQLTVLESVVSPSKIRKASLLATVTSAEKLFKMERLERGLSTENISTKTFTTLEIKP